MCMCVCMCVCARARACVHVHILNQKCNSHKSACVRFLTIVFVHEDTMHVYACVSMCSSSRQFITTYVE